MLKTRFSLHFGLNTPIALAPMALASGGALASACARSGILGLIGGGYGELAWLQKEHALALAHQDIPIEVILSALKIPRQAGVNPLFQAIFVYQNFIMDHAANFSGLKTSYYDANGGITNDDLLMEVRPHGQEIQIFLKFEERKNLIRQNPIAN
mgnify:CR=1 FL=1